MATLLAAAPASASGMLSPAARRDLEHSGGVAYGPTYATPIEPSSPEARRLAAALRSSFYMELLRDELQVTQFAGTIADFMGGTKEWSRVTVPATAARTLGGAQLYLAKGSSRYRMLFAVRGDRLYHMPNDYTQLLYDGGQKFRNSDVSAWAPTLVFICLAAGGYNVLSTGAWDTSYAVGQDCDSVFSGVRPLVEAYSLSALVADTVPLGHADPWVGPGFIREVRMKMNQQPLTYDVVIGTSGGHAQRGLYPNSIWLEGLGQFSFTGPRLSLLDDDSLRTRGTSQFRFARLTRAALS